jgi:hypothetical protein
LGCKQCSSYSVYFGILALQSNLFQHHVLMQLFIYLPRSAIRLICSTKARLILLDFVSPEPKYRASTAHSRCLMLADFKRSQ